MNGREPGIPLSCAAVRDLLLRDPEESPRAAATVHLQEHLSRCTTCAAEAEREERVRSLLRRDPLPFTQVRLPSGHDLVSGVAEAANREVRSSRSRLTMLRWTTGLTFSLLALFGLARLPSRGLPTPAPQTQVPASTTSGFWIDDDERTGRTVILESHSARLHPE